MKSRSGYFSLEFKMKEETISVDETVTLKIKQDQVKQETRESDEAMIEQEKEFLSRLVLCALSHLPQ